MSYTTKLWPDHTDRRATRFLELFSVHELLQLASPLQKDLESSFDTVSLPRAVVNVLQRKGQPCQHLFALLGDELTRRRGKVEKYLESEAYRWVSHNKKQAPAVMVEDLSHFNLDMLEQSICNYWEQVKQKKYIAGWAVFDTARNFS